MVEDRANAAREAKRNLARSILTKIDAATTETEKLEAIERAVDGVAKTALRMGLMQGQLGGVGFRDVLGGASWTVGGEDTRVKCKKCEKEIIERYAKKRLGFCKACFEEGLNNGEVIR